MKLTTFFLLAAILSVSANSFGQRVTLNTRNATLESVLQSIRQQTGFDYAADEQLLNNAKTVTLRIEDIELSEALKKIFSDQSLTYSLNNKAIVIKRRELSLIDRIKEALAAINVTGRVTDDTGQPLFAASVAIKGGKIATTTNADGFFTMKDVQPNSFIVVSYVGFDKKEVPAAPNMGVIRLSRSNSKLDEIQVIAYGTTTQRLSTGSLNKVSGTAIERQPQSNPILSLAGQVPGLFITSNSGYAGSNISVNIRGQNSLNSLTTQPLYVIDGIPFGSQPVEQSVGGFAAGVGFSPLNTINPDDIESISVLKDADATAIYGSRGAAGVILITTKKGRPGTTQFTVDVSGGDGKVTNLVKMASTSQYLDVRRQAFTNDGVTPNATNAPELVTWPSDANTDFGKLIAGETAHQLNASFSASGGNEQTQFVFGGNIRSQSSIYHSQTKDNAQQFNLSVQHKSSNRKFGLEASVNYNLDNNTIPNYTINYLSYSLPPNYPLYNANGSLYFGPGYTNPLAAFNIINNMKSANLIANSTLHYTILPGLDIKTSGGYNKIEVNGATITPASALNPASNYLQTSGLNNNYIQTYILEPQANYNHTWGRHKLSALLGGAWQETQTVQPYYIFGSFSNIQLAKSLNALNVVIKSSGYADYKYVSGFSRVSYSFADKYLINVNLRRDGSSRFGSDRQFGNFGSIGAAWIFSEESFIKKSAPWLSYGKLRGSWGTIGNDRIQDYLYESLYMVNGVPYGTLNGYGPSRVSNPYLQWEVTKKIDLSLDLGFFNSRLLFSANVYRNRSNNLLGYITIPSQTGFSNYQGNMPASIQNRGIEFEMNTVNIKNRDFRWSSSLNLTIPQNKLVDFPNIQSSIYASQYVIGKSLSYTPMYKFAGFVNGIATAEDINQDGAISSGLAVYGNGDRTGSANADPKLFGGFSNTISYKGWQVDFLIQGTVRDAGRGDLGLGSQPGMSYNIPASMLDIPVSYTATSGTASANAWQYYIGSDAAWESAAYLRLRNISVTYDFKPSWISRLKMKTLQVYVRGQNLLTITGYKGLDPETFDALPPMKIIVAGLRTTF